MQQENWYRRSAENDHVAYEFIYFYFIMNEQNKHDKRVIKPVQEIRRKNVLQQRNQKYDKRKNTKKNTSTYRTDAIDQMWRIRLRFIVY